MASTVGTRLAFEKAKEAINRAGFSLGQAVLSQSYLRLEVALSTTVTSYQFPVLTNDVSATNTSSFVTEQRLNLQDAFVCSSIGLFFWLHQLQQLLTFSCVLIRIQLFLLQLTLQLACLTGTTVAFL